MITFDLLDSWSDEALLISIFSSLDITEYLIPLYNIFIENTEINITLSAIT